MQPRAPVCHTNTPMQKQASHSRRLLRWSAHAARLGRYAQLAERATGKARSHSWHNSGVRYVSVLRSAVQQAAAAAEREGEGVAPTFFSES
jgi:hypothetical protein